MKAARYDKEYFESPEEAGLVSLDDVKDLPYILEFLSLKPKERILDVGCGLGRFDGVIVERGAEVTGIDISEYAIEQARRRYKGRKELQFICMNALDIDYENYFDKVLCYHFIEHLTLADGRILLRKIHNALKNGGVLVIGLPINDFTLARRMLRIVAHRPKGGRPTHLVSFSIEEIKREIISAGFSITSVCPLSYSTVRLPEGVSRIPFFRQAILCADMRAIKK